MKKILLIDSGSGGVNILKECVKVCPYCNFLLFCDDKNLPYGSKTKEELQKITIENLQNIKKFFDFEIVILACNTLTCTCIDVLREVFPDTIFIGTVPAVKPALENFAAKDVLVLATPATIAHNISINKNSQIKTLALPKLASQIDAHLDEIEILKPELESEINNYLIEIYKKINLKNNPKNKLKIEKNAKKLKKIIKNRQKIEFFNKNPLKNKKIQIFKYIPKSKSNQTKKCNLYSPNKNTKPLASVIKIANCSNKSTFWKPKAVVLGCTHYIAVKDLLQQILGSDVQFFDSANGVARRLKYFVGSSATPGYQVQIMTSQNTSALASFCWWFNK